MANYSDVKASGAIVKSYANFAAFPSSGNSAGDLVLALDTGGIYVWDGSEWDRVASGVDELPEFTTEPAASYDLNDDGTATVITVAATDPEGFPITYSYDTVPSNQAQATITNSGGTFTVTPTTTEADAGTFSLRFKASDGVNVSSKTSTMNLSFYSGLLDFSPSIDGASSWDSVNGAASVSLTDTTQEYTVTNNNNNAITIQFDVQGASGHIISGRGSAPGTGGRAIATYTIPASSSVKMRLGAAPTANNAGGGASAVYSSSDSNVPYIVAGGGGGGSDTSGGHGGGLTGNHGTDNTSWNADGGHGGTQTAGGTGGGGSRGNGSAGSFRQGGNAYYNSTNGPGGDGWAPGGRGGFRGGDGWQGGGGGGYYGGGGGGADAAGAGGGGGSGFIGNGAISVSNTTGGAEQTNGKIVMTPVP